MTWLIPLLLLEIIGLAIALGPGTSPSRRLLSLALVIMVPLAGPALALLVRGCRGGGLEPERDSRLRPAPRLRPDEVRLLGDQPPMLDRLISTDASERLAAMVTLCHTGDPTSVSLLRWVVEHASPDVALEAALALEEMDLRREAQLATA